MLEERLVIQNIINVMMVSLVLFGQVTIIGAIMTYAIFIRITRAGKSMVLKNDVLVWEQGSPGKTKPERCSIGMHVDVLLAEDRRECIKYRVNKITLCIETDFSQMITMSYHTWNRIMVDQVSYAMQPRHKRRIHAEQIYL